MLRPARAALLGPAWRGGAADASIALGHTNQQVAGMLRLSVKTVETYKSRLMTKLGLAGRAALVRYALQRGLLEEPE
jgi:FixJ family two-component response regulator